MGVVVAVLTVMLSSALLSPQYMTWPLPWIAIVATGARDRLMVGVAAAATTVTTLMWFLPLHGILAFQSLILARNATLVLLLALACRRLAGRRRAGPTPELARLPA